MGPELTVRAVGDKYSRHYQWYVDQYSHREKRPNGGYTFHTKEGHTICDGPIHNYFGLTYASWLILPRLSLQEMPLDWQAKFAALMDEAVLEHGLAIPEGLYVSRKISGKFAGLGEWGQYRRGTVQDAIQDDLRRGLLSEDELETAA